RDQLFLLLLLLFLLQTGDHLPGATMLGAHGEHFEAFLLRSPLQDVDIHMPDAPAFHLEATRFIKVDSVGADERAAIIVDDILLISLGDSEPCAEREMRPIGSGAHHMLARKTRVKRVVASAPFAMCISGGAHVLHALRAANRRIRLRGAAESEASNE